MVLKPYPFCLENGFVKYVQLFFYFHFLHPVFFKFLLMMAVLISFISSGKDTNETLLLVSHLAEKEKGDPSKNRLKSSYVPGTGFEPAHPFGRHHLKVVRLPISPPGQLFQ